MMQEVEQQLFHKLSQVLWSWRIKNLLYRFSQNSKFIDCIKYEEEPNGMNKLKTKKSLNSKGYWVDSDFQEWGQRHTNDYSINNILYLTFYLISQ